jgi:hypothetical protein
MGNVRIWGGPVFLLLVFSAWGGASAPRPQEKASEPEVKAAFIYNFALNTEWPSSVFKDDKDAIQIAVLGSDPVAEVLEKICGTRTAQNRALKLLRWKTSKEAGSCHILFLGESQKEALEEVVAATRGVPCLLVGESEGAAKKGAVLNFFPDGGRIRFEANLEEAGRRGVKLGAKLLKIARVIGS